MDDEDFAKHRRKCINRVKKLIRDVDVCIDVFELDTSIPQELAHRALNVVFGIFGPRSIEMMRYSKYEHKWESGSKTERRVFLDSLSADLISGLERLESNSLKRWIQIGFGSVENEQHPPIDVAKTLGLPDNETRFIKRLRRLCGRLETALQFDCLDAAAYYLRKILEVSIISRCAFDRNESYCDSNGRTKGLDVLIDLVLKESGDNGYIDSRVAKRLRDDKILWDRSVHDLYSEPSRDSLIRAMDFVGQALAEMRIDELR